MPRQLVLRRHVAAPGGRVVEPAGAGAPHALQRRHGQLAAAGGGRWEPADALDIIICQNHTELLIYNAINKNSSLPRPSRAVCHSAPLPAGLVDWFSAAEVYLSPEETTQRLMRTFGKKLGFQKSRCSVPKSSCDRRGIFIWLISCYSADLLSSLI